VVAGFAKKAVQVLVIRHRPYQRQHGWARGGIIGYRAVRRGVRQRCG